MRKYFKRLYYVGMLKRLKEIYEHESGVDQYTESDQFIIELQQETIRITKKLRKYEP